MDPPRTRRYAGERFLLAIGRLVSAFALMAFAFCTFVGVVTVLGWLV